MKEYDKFDTLPKGQASKKLINACIVVEGGALRGVYCQGVMDALMQNDINATCLIGVSSGALNGVNYLSGQIGRGIYLTLKYRHDSRFIGLRAMIENHGIAGFKYMWTTVQKTWPLNEEYFYDSNRRFLCVATNLNTGKPRFFEHMVDDEKTFLMGLQAGASVPFVSQPILIENAPYLDGGLSMCIPFKWAIKENFDKIIVLRTRDRSYRSLKLYSNSISKIFYKKYPKIIDNLRFSSYRYNKDLDKLDELEKKKRLYVIAPSKKLELNWFCNDLNELADLYFLGLNDGNNQIESLKKYLEE